MATKEALTFTDGHLKSRIRGCIRLTSKTSIPVTLQKGILSVYSSKGTHFCTVCQNAEGKLRAVFRRFTLEKNIRQINQRGGNITIVLLNEFQIILKECDQDVAETLAKILEKIKAGLRQSFSSSKDPKEPPVITISPTKLGHKHSSLGDISNRIVPKMKKRHLPTPLRNISTAFKKVVHGKEESPSTDKKHLPSQKSSFYGRNLDEATPPKIMKCISPVKRKSVFGEHVTQSLPTNHRFKYTKTKQLDNSPIEINLSPKRDEAQLKPSPGPLRTRLFPTSENQVQTKPKGFTNMGNTCYMNAVLQSLLELKQFSSKLKLWKKLSKDMDKPLLNAVLLLLETKEKNKNVDSDQFCALYKLKKVIDDSMKKFLGFEQQDAHEFLLCLLDQLKDEIASLKKQLDEAIVASNDLLCPVQTNFESIVANKITCVSCNKETIKEEIYNDIAIDLPKECNEEMLNLQDLLCQAFKDEPLTCQCEGCDETNAVCCRRFHKVPRILVLHLKRYRCSLTDLFSLKNQKHVRIPKEITVGGLSTSSVTVPPKLTSESPSQNKENIPLLRQSQEHISSTNTISSPLQFSRLQPKHSQLDLSPIKSHNHTAIVDKDTTRNQPASIRDAKFASIDEIDLEDEEYKTKYESDLQEAINASLDEDDELQKALQMSMQDTFLQPQPSATCFDSATSMNSDFLITEPTTLPKISEDEGPSINYQLLGVVSHIGESAAIGHYVCDMYDEDLKEWKTFNDESITKVTEYEVRLGRQHSGYVFFYGLK